jgi:S1-C subfamily serine protease
MLYHTIVKIYSTALEPAYHNAWTGPRISTSSGTGFFCLYEGKQYIITNAHVVNYGTYIQVKLAEAKYPTKYPAKVKVIGRDCDLAIIEVSDPEFLKTVQYLELSDALIKPGDKVKTVGFPIGGEECSETNGVISRNEYSTYAFSQFLLFNTSIDAKISPGNSGGPVLNEKQEVVGVVHQGNPDGKTLGQMIPLPILRHFLEDATKNLRYKGFPGFPLIYQNMENPNLRKFYKMQPDHTGVLINEVPECSPAYNILQPDDVLLEIDKVPINNTGKVSVSELNTPIHFMHVLHRKYVGDTITFKILRNQETFIVNINLNISLESHNLIPLKTDDINPSYFEHSGIILQPVTINYFDTFKNSTGINPPSTLLPYYGKQLYTTKDKTQLLIIRNILEDEQTQNYSSFKNAVVKSINGQKIKNLWSAIHAFENNSNEFHIIKTENNKTLIIKNLSLEENENLRKRYEIKEQKAPQYLEKNSKWIPFLGTFFVKQKEHTKAMALKEALEEKTNLKII